MIPSITDIYHLVDQKKALLIDVREINEWNESHLSHAIHCPLSQLKNHTPSLPLNTSLYIHCHRGFRAQEAANLLKKTYNEVIALPYTFEQMKLEEALYLS